MTETVVGQAAAALHHYAGRLRDANLELEIRVSRDGTAVLLDVPGAPRLYIVASTALRGDGTPVIVNLVDGSNCYPTCDRETERPATM